MLTHKLFLDHWTTDKPSLEAVSQTSWELIKIKYKES